MFKRIVGGDRIGSEAKYQDRISITPTIKLIFGMNELPNFYVSTEGLIERMLCAHFYTKFRHEDDQEMQSRFVNALASEADGILSDSIWKYVEAYKEKGFTISDAAKEKTEEYKTDMDEEMEFVNGCLTSTGDLTDKAGVLEIYEHLKLWSQQHGKKNAIKHRRLYNLIKRAHPTSIRKEGYIDSKQQQVIYGVTFKEIETVTEWAQENGPQANLLS